MDRNLQTILLTDNPWLQEPASLADWLRLRLPPVYLPSLPASPARSRVTEVHRAHLLIWPSPDRARAVGRRAPRPATGLRRLSRGLAGRESGGPADRSIGVDGLAGCERSVSDRPS